MSRVIKFRAWDGERMLSQDAIDWDGDSFVSGIWNYEETEIIDDITHPEIMQFTGLRDKHGVEIYEGDIVKVVIQVHHSRPVESVRLVAFENAAFYLSHPNISHYCKSLLGNLSYNASVEKIGNIHQHPELLEEAGNE